MWKAGAATTWCRRVQRDAAPTDSVMQQRRSFLSYAVLNKAHFDMCCWSPACALSQLVTLTSQRGCLALLSLEVTVQWC